MQTTTQASPSVPRATIVERIRKLAKLTTANGCTEAEALAAANMLARLMAEHNVAQSELDIRREAAHCVQDEFIELRAHASEWIVCCNPIARLFGTRVWTQRREEDILGLGTPEIVTTVQYFGLAADVAASVALSGIIYTAMCDEASGYGRTYCGKGKANALSSFRLGMASRINDRLREMARQEPMPGASAGALVVLKSQLVNAEFDKLGLHIGKFHARGMTINSSAYAAGQAAGSRVDLNRKVGGAQAAIGKS